MNKKIVDLHGYTHFEADRLIVKTLNEFLGSGTIIEFVTGHSDKMKDLVRNVAKSYYLKTLELRDTDIIVYT
jgi:hypothetical protein